MKAVDPCTPLPLTPQPSPLPPLVHHKKKGGTPDLVGAVRAALALRLKRLAWPSPPAFAAAQRASVAAATAALAACPALVLLGGGGESEGESEGENEEEPQQQQQERVPIFSFLVRRGGRFLHYNFVGALLNDLFGIQTRGGCQCAGPYSQVHKYTRAPKGRKEKERGRLKEGFT